MNAHSHSRTLHSTLHSNTLHGNGPLHSNTLDSNSTQHSNRPQIANCRLQHVEHSITRTHARMM